MRVDEGRREHEARALDDAVLVGVEARPELGDRPAVDAHVADGVDAFRGVEHPRAADHDVVLTSVPGEEHHATSSGSPALTGTGPVVSRS